MNHDPLCPRSKADLGVCECRRIDEIREDERRVMSTVEGLSAYDVAEAAYVRGRQDACEAITSYEMHALPMVENDTPMSLAVRVKGVCAGLAVGRKPDLPESGRSPLIVP